MPTMPPTPLAKIISHARTADWTLHNKHTQLCTIPSYSCCYYSTSLPPISSPTWDKKKYYTAHQICSQVFHNVQNYSSYCSCHLFRKQLGLQLLLRGTCRDLLLLQCQQPSVKLELACRVRLVECGVCKHCPILLRCKLLKRTRANFCSARLADCATHLCSHLETTRRDKNTNSSRLRLVSVSGSPLCNYGTL